MRVKPFFFSMSRCEFAFFVYKRRNCCCDERSIYNVRLFTTLGWIKDPFFVFRVCLRGVGNKLRDSCKETRFYFPTELWFVFVSGFLILKPCF